MLRLDNETCQGARQSKLRLGKASGDRHAQLLAPHVIEACACVSSVLSGFDSYCQHWHGRKAALAYTATHDLM
eukprot:364849-Chlamydomonas_euryale.AAC.12